MRPEDLTRAFDDIWCQPQQPARDPAYLIEMDRRLSKLRDQRRAFVSAAHELSHCVLLDGLDEANNAGMASALNAINLAGGLIQPTDAGWLTFPTGDTASPHMIVIPK